MNLITKIFYKPFIDIENEHTQFNINVIRALLAFFLWYCLDDLFSFGLGTVFSKRFLLTHYYIAAIIKFLCIPVLIYIFKELFEDKDSNTINTFNKTQNNNLIYFAILVITFRLLFDAYISPLLELIPEGKVLTNYESLTKLSPSFYIVSLIISCTYAPIVEETIARGIVLNGLLNKYSKTFSIVLSALLFAVMHMNIHQGINAFLLGCFLGYIYAETKSLFLCMFTHFFNNFYIMFISFPENIIQSIVGSGIKLIIVNCIIYTLIAIPLIIILKKNFHMNYNNDFITNKNENNETI